MGQLKGYVCKERKTFMSGGIYLIRDDGELVEMSEQAYDSEDLLQELLADYPNLLAGDQTSDTEPQRFLLVSREMSLSR